MREARLLWVMGVPEEYERTSSLLVISVVSPQDDTGYVAGSGRGFDGIGGKFPLSLEERRWPGD